MKRCSQCEFTFDDHQQTCDFDGTELTAIEELPPAFRTVSLAPAVSSSPLRRLIQSRAFLAVLALVGVVSSALLVGYYDSVNQANIDVASTAQTQNDMVSVVPHPAEKADQAKLEPVAKPRRISTQRKIRADEKSPSMSSMLKLESSASRSSQSKPASRRGPSTSRLANSTRKRATTSASKTLATKQRPAKANQQLTARNHGTFRRRDPGSAYRRDSRFVAILKRTGNILTKPFKLLGD